MMVDMQAWVVVVVVGLVLKGSATLQADNKQVRTPLGRWLVDPSWVESSMTLPDIGLGMMTEVEEVVRLILSSTN